MVKTYGMGKPVGCIVVASCGSVMHDKRRGGRGLHGVCVCVRHWVIVVLFGTGRKSLCSLVYPYMSIVDIKQL